MSMELMAQEITALKQRMDKMEVKMNLAPRGAWRELIGSQKDDALFREAVRLGAEWRAKANAEGR
jgi:hypothetical protein